MALLSQVLEHMTNPLETVRNLHTVLRPGRIAAIAVPRSGGVRLKNVIAGCEAQENCRDISVVKCD